MAAFGYNGRVEQLQQRLRGPQSLKHLPFGTLQKKRCRFLPGSVAESQEQRRMGPGITVRKATAEHKHQK